MSDYQRAAMEELPLFCTNTLVASPSIEQSGKAARRHHESQGMQREALWRLRDGELLTDAAWKELHPGSRIAPVVEKLRNTYGFEICGEGSANRPYGMLDRNEWPQTVEVTEAIKEAYWASTHWHEVRERRWAYDKWACVLCKAAEPLQCHHIFYALFEEKLCHVMTVCEACHELCHSQSRLKFPAGMSVKHARQLGVNVEFASWLLPHGGRFNEAAN